MTAATPLENLHTHTARCNHASGSVRDYVQAAREKKMPLLGLSDHMPRPDGRWKSSRMMMNELTAYEDEILRAREEFDDIHIAKGLECEYLPELRSYIEDELLGARGFEYLIGAVHYVNPDGGWKDFHLMTDPRDLLAYAKLVVKTMESGLFLFFAHPDLFGYSYREWDVNAQACGRDILAAARALDIPLEINGYGMRKGMIETKSGERWKYPWLHFWDLATEYDVRVIASSDAHEPENVDGNIKDGLKIARDRGLRLVKPSQLLSHRAVTDKIT